MASYFTYNSAVVRFTARLLPVTLTGRIGDIRNGLRLKLSHVDLSLYNHVQGGNAPTTHRAKTME
jgi:hypothetical protein